MMVAQGTGTIMWVHGGDSKLSSARHLRSACTCMDHTDVPPEFDFASGDHVSAVIYLSLELEMY